MLCLVVLLVLLGLWDVDATINLTYILKKDGDRIQPSCIAEESERYAAVGWVYPIATDQEEIPNITTKFIPTILNDYNCKFSTNDLCTTKWRIKNWHVEESTDFLADLRWEDLPTVFISNTTKEVKERIEIPKVFKTGISVRAGETIEILVCNGWDPYNYPCYYFNINKTDIYLKKYATLPNDTTDTFKSYLTNYKAYTSILSLDEWRNFVVSFDENNTLELFDVNLNRTVIEYTDEIPLSPAYLLIRSSNASLWKIHKNDVFYTNSAQISRLGPELTINNKDLCVSLLVTTCPTCEIIFFYLVGVNRRVLKRLGPLENGEWVETKLKVENIPFDKLYIFVETRPIDGTLNGTEGFWAIDNVRVCNENEVKVSFLKFNYSLSDNDVSEETISCQLIKKPSWRPKLLSYNKITDFPQVNVTENTTSIKLSWQQEDPNNQISYFTTYKANDLCSAEPHNLKRVKSGGFVTTKLNELLLDNLVPFTVYNVTISTVLHEEESRLYINTLETVEPSFEELPHKIKVIPTESTVFVSWDEVNCTSKYGRLIYTISVINKRLNFVKKLEYQTENHYEIDKLEPFTQYTLNITTARSAVNINHGIHSSSVLLNFSTLAGVAAAVENLELYSIDQNSASLRYDLPRHPNGVPEEVRVTRCNALSFKKCKSSISRITRCPLWPRKFCVFVNNILEFQNFNFNVALKNLRTERFGKEVSVQGYTVDRIPGAPTNVTYKVVDCVDSTEYCNLNVTWSHPYNENGTITSFELILNSTDKYKNSEEDKYIQEVYQVVNKSYLPIYTHQIKVIPYSALYVLHLYSANRQYISESATLLVKTDNIGDHIDQSPKLLGNSDSTLIFEIPFLDRRLESYTLTVVVQDFDKNRTVDADVLENKKVASYLCHNFGHTWISQTVKIQRFEHDVVYYEKLETPDAPPSVKEASSSGRYNHLYILLLLLLLLPAGFLVYRYLRKRRVIKNSSENPENIYESMPFDDCDTNCVTNENYDKLLHK
ncbi:hypothetical protein NQ317_011332 [Molorchus minor]|uniref:Fibronectin type-III domain-containing protein n=1 Tax=Molorchus minor TaxID=1323400 RepID=A0ABQ9J5K7_9CUCU|nr:hypothetical protein NQ317_011332 [Molorchus minor]